MTPRFPIEEPPPFIERRRCNRLGTYSRTQGPGAPRRRRHHALLGGCRTLDDGPRPARGDPLL